MVVPYAVDTDFLLIDGLELVTVKTVDADSGSASDTKSGVRAFRTPASVAPIMVADGGEVPKERCRFHLYAADLSSKATLKKRDTITDAGGVTWTIERFGRQVFDSCYACECVRV